MNNTDILEEDVKNILNCCIDIETLISLDERAKEDLKNNTHNIQQQEVLTIIREFIRCKNDCSNLIAENKELKEENNELEVINKIQEYRISVIDERELISKSKVKEEIDGKFKEAKGLYERGVQPQAQYTMKLLRDLEQSLLGKE